MCSKCPNQAAQAESGAIQAQNIAVGQVPARPQDAKKDITVLVTGRTDVAIKPFATLDDALISAGKVAKLVYPDANSDEENDFKYQCDLLRAATYLGAVPVEQRYSALVAVLTVVLMGFDPDDIESVKAHLNESLTALAEAKVVEQTSNFLKESGFIHDMKG